MTVHRTPEVKTQTPEAFLSRPWAEIRESFKSKPYWQYLRENLRGITYLQKYQIPPDIHKDQKPEDIRKVDRQIARATLEGLVQFLELDISSYTTQDGICQIKDGSTGGTIKARISEQVHKFQIEGSKYNPDYSEPNILTRVYLGIDPRYATDEFFLLVKELIKSGALSDNMMIALNLDEQRKLATENVIIYVPKSQTNQERLTKIFAAYQAARKSDEIGFNPFGLDKQQRDYLSYSNLRTYKYLLNDMMAVVEMASDDGNDSYDVSAFSEINGVANVNPLRDDDITVVNKLLKSAKTGRVVYKKADNAVRQRWARAKIEGDESDLEFVGTELKSKRDLRYPCLVEMQTHQIARDGQNYKY